VFDLRKNYFNFLFSYSFMKLLSYDLKIVTLYLEKFVQETIETNRLFPIQIFENINDTLKKMRRICN
jgi:hypothetical protein